MLPDPFLPPPLTISTLSHTSETSSRRPRHSTCLCLCSPITPPPSNQPCSSSSSPHLQLPPAALVHVSAAAANLHHRTSHPHPCSTISNVTILSSILASLVAELDSDHRVLWCQIMDTLASRLPSTDLNFSLSLPPTLPSLAEQAYLNHSHSLPQSVPNPRCHVCGAHRPDTREFAWVDEDEDHHTLGPLVPSFEHYVCDVLDTKGKRHFIAERFGPTHSINTRALLAKFGKHLGMTTEEVDIAIKHSYEQPDCADDTIPEDNESSVSGVSDIESLHRSENDTHR